MYNYELHTCTCTCTGNCFIKRKNKFNEEIINNEIIIIIVIRTITNY